MGIGLSNFIIIPLAERNFRHYERNSHFFMSNNDDNLDTIALVLGITGIIFIGLGLVMSFHNPPIK